MDWQVILALIIMIPIILSPVLLVWYINVGGIYAAIKSKRVASEEAKGPPAEAKQSVVADEQATAK